MASKLKDIHVVILQALDIVEVSWVPCSVTWMFGALLEDYQNDVVPIFKKVRVRLSSFGEIYSRVPQRSVQQIVKRQIFLLFFQACRGTVHHLCRACCRQILSLPLHYP